MFSQGYIGVTSKTAQERFKEHVAIARQPKNQNKFILHSAINKHGVDSMVIDTICICDKEYAFMLEGKLRPERATGWNTSVGGYGAVGKRKYGPMNEEVKAKIAYANSHPRDETRENKRQGQFKRFSKERDIFGWSDEFLYTRNMRKPESPKKRFWKNPKCTIHLLNTLYFNADKIFDIYKYADGKILPAFIVEMFGIGGDTPVKSLFKFFEAGWIPEKDEDWVSDFKGTFFMENRFLPSAEKYHPNKIDKYNEKMHRERQEWIMQHNKG